MAMRWTCEVRHDGLGKYRVISGSDKAVVEAKARAQRVEWENKYQQILEARREKDRIISQKQRLQESRERKKEELEEKLHDAEDQTQEAQQAVEAVKNILQSALKSRCTVDWEKLKKRPPFPKPKPKPPEYREFPVEPKSTDDIYQPALSTTTTGPDGPIFLQQPPAPNEAHPKYKPGINILDKFIKSRMEEKLRAAQFLYEYDFKKWEEEMRQTVAENQRRANELFRHDLEVWANAVEFVRKKNEEIYSKNLAEVEQWNLESESYQANIEKNNAVIDERRAKYESFQKDGIEDYCEMVLANSEYPDDFPQSFDLEYNPETKILIVEHSLPAPEHLPRLKEVKYVKSKDDFTESFLSENELNKLYDDALYQICLRALHELFDADGVNAIAAISFNGWVNSVDKATGKEANACVLSIQVKKDEFQAINLQNVEPKTCFKSLKGIGSSKLHSLTPVAPVLTISRDDKRFVVSHEVASQLNEGVNLAAMDWEEFEHLIRQLFEQEFKQSGGEVKITQASRDGGVDAVAFDPDVIRGGKTVIQAKRYTNTVGVSAVRDLYGTVLNEGASRGILVTTSDYGPDSYDFAKGKPLVLLNGANLLNLLEKHGHKAKIDLKEAKTILAEQS
jgi:restriction system protein